VQCFDGGGATGKQQKRKEIHLLYIHGKKKTHPQIALGKLVEEESSIFWGSERGESFKKWRKRKFQRTGWQRPGGIEKWIIFRKRKTPADGRKAGGKKICFHPENRDNKSGGKGGKEMGEEKKRCRLWKKEILWGRSPGKGGGGTRGIKFSQGLHLGKLAYSLLGQLIAERRILRREGGSFKVTIGRAGKKLPEGEKSGVVLKNFGGNNP